MAKFTFTRGVKLLFLDRARLLGLIEFIQKNKACVIHQCRFQKIINHSNKICVEQRLDPPSYNGQYPGVCLTGDLWFIFVTRTQRDESPCSCKYFLHNQEYVLTVLY